MADEWTNQRQDEMQVPQEGDAQGIILGEAPLSAQPEAPDMEFETAPQEPLAVPMEAYDPAAVDAAQVAYDTMPQLDFENAPQQPEEIDPYRELGALPDPMLVRTITVRTGRLVIDVEIPDARCRYTTPRLSAFANGQYPDLPKHACVNDLGNTFGYVMERTSVPHLLEHLIISEQVRRQPSSTAIFVGTTEWTDEEAGIARVEVGFKDDLVALRAFNEATRFLNMAVLTCLV